VRSLPEAIEIYIGWLVLPKARPALARGVLFGSWMGKNLEDAMAMTMSKLLACENTKGACEEGSPLEEVGRAEAGG